MRNTTLFALNYYLKMSVKRHIHISKETETGPHCVIVIGPSREGHLCYHYQECDMCPSCIQVAMYGTGDVEYPIAL